MIYFCFRRKNSNNSHNFLLSPIVADENLNATADKFAVISGWAYHQNQNNNNNNRSPTNIASIHNRSMLDQWPPPSSTSSSSIVQHVPTTTITNNNNNNDENSTSSERSKVLYIVF